MAIAFDAVSVGDSTGATTTVSHTCTGDDRLLICNHVQWASSWTPNDGSATYAGASMTNIQGLRWASGGPNRITAYIKTAPATGANNVVTTRGTGAFENVQANVSYTGVDQSTPNDTPGTAVAANTTSITQNVSSETGDLVVDLIGKYEYLSAAPGAGQTKRADNNNGSSFNSAITSEEAGAATVTMSWSAGTSHWGQIAFNLNAAGAGSLKHPGMTGGMQELTGGIRG